MTASTSHSLRLDYANVVDCVEGLPGAAGDGSTDDTSAIQRAIDTGLHVVFPGRGYRVSRPLVFHDDDQRVTFLAGAQIVLVSSSASVHITGKRQTFTGLWIHVGKDSSQNDVFPEPCLLVQGADDLLLQEPRVDCSAAAVPVRVKDSAGVTIVGGSLRSP